MRKLKFVDRIILIGVVCMAVFILILFLSGKRNNRDIYLPVNFEGWVKIKHALPGAPQLDNKDGIYQIYVSDSGYVETSTYLESGWGRDRFFSLSPEGAKQIPNYLDEAGEKKVFVHAKSAFQVSHEHILADLPEGIDTLLWDGTRIKKSEGRVSYTTGKKTLEYFYISAQAQPLAFNPPPNPDTEMLKSTEDHEIPAK